MKIRIATVFLMTWLVASGPTFAAEPPNGAAQRAGYAGHLLDLINQYRQRNQLPQLALDERLGVLAEEHAVDMARSRRLSHDGFDGRFDRARSQMCVENVGWNYRHAEGQLDGWRHSAGHNRNLLEYEVRRVGIAVFQGYVAFFACA